MRRRFLLLLLFITGLWPVVAQLNTERITYIGRNALYFEDYVLAIQYFNRVIQVKPYLADPYFYRSVAKLSLEDFLGGRSRCYRGNKAQSVYCRCLSGAGYRPAEHR